jgi:hypothetical protein
VIAGIALAPLLDLTWALTNVLRTLDDRLSAFGAAIPD